MAASSFVFSECLQPSAPTRSKDENQPGCSLTGDGVLERLSTSADGGWEGIVLRQCEDLLLCAARLYKRFNLLLLELPEIAQLYRGQFRFPFPGGVLADPA